MVVAPYLCTSKNMPYRTYQWYLCYLPCSQPRPVFHTLSRLVSLLLSPVHVNAAVGLGVMCALMVTSSLHLQTRKFSLPCLTLYLLGVTSCLTLSPLGLMTCLTKNAWE